jgi:hypothetical protein
MAAVCRRPCWPQAALVLVSGGPVIAPEDKGVWGDAKHGGGVRRRANRCAGSATRAARAVRGPVDRSRGRPGVTVLW